MGKLVTIAAAAAAVLGIAWWIGRKHEEDTNTAAGQNKLGNPLFDPENYAGNSYGAGNSADPNPEIKPKDNTSIQVSVGGRANIDQAPIETPYGFLDPSMNQDPRDKANPNWRAN